MPPRRHRSSTLSSTPSQPEPPTPRPRLRPRRRNSALDRSLALRNLNIGVDSSEVSIDPASSPTVTSFSGHSLVRATKVVAESEASEGGFWHNQSPLRLRNGRTEGGVGGSGGGGRGGEEVSRVATAKGSPWTSDDLERLYRTVKITRHDLAWTTVGDRVGDRIPDECTAKWKEIEGRIIEFIRSMGEAGNAGDVDESASAENDDGFGDDEWEDNEVGSDYADEEYGEGEKDEKEVARDEVVPAGR